MPLERGEAGRPGGVEVGPRREAAGELEVDHPVGEGPGGAGPVLVAAERVDEGLPGARLEPFRETVARQRPAVSSR